MKARQVKTKKVENFLKELEEMRNKSGGGDPNFINIPTPDRGKKLSFQFRPIGDMESIRTHYLGNLIPNWRDLEIGLYLNCIGRYSGCPLCDINNALNEVGGPKAKERQRDFWSAEKNFWNVLPRYEYDFGESGERFLILAFGATARKSLEEIVADYGHPGEIEDGYDLDYLVTRKVKGMGSDYEFKIHMERQRKGKNVSLEYLKPLTGEELDLELVDISQYTKEPDSETLEIIQDMFNVENLDLILEGKKPKTEGETEDNQEQTSESEKEDEVELDDLEDDDGKPLCFADVDVHNPKDPECRICDYYRECRTEVKMKTLKG